MWPFTRNEKRSRIPYDPATQEPAVRRSICTGEMTVGFINKNTGQFHEYLLAPDQAALEAFCRDVGIEVSAIRTIY